MNAAAATGGAGRRFGSRTRAAGKRAILGARRLSRVLIMALYLSPGAACADNVMQGINIELWGPRELGAPEERVARAAKAGLTLVRLGEPWGPWLSGADESRLAAAKSALRRAVSRSLAEGMKTVVTLFAVGGPKGASVGAVVCGDPEIGERYARAVSDIIALLPNRPEVALEPLNEPPTGCSARRYGVSTGADWPRLQMRIYKEMRKEKSELTFVVNAGDWGKEEGLLAFDPSFYVSDPHSVFTYHYYEPMIFTHQGTEFGEPFYRFLRHVPGPAEPARAQMSQSLTKQGMATLTDPEARRRAAQAASAAFGDYSRSGSQAYLDRRFDAAADWAKTHGVAASRIFVGETGVARADHNISQSPPEDAATFLAHVGLAAEKRGFTWAIWELDEGFGVMCGPYAHEYLCPSYAQSLRYQP